MMSQNLLSVHDVPESALQEIFRSAEECRLHHELSQHRNQCGTFGQYLQGKVMGTLFLEPSTRTRWSFEAAMIRLGGHVVSAHSESCSSQIKGESFEDTLHTVSQYVDTLVVRSPNPLTDTRGNYNFCIPEKRIINGGDGSHEHPTQAILDAFTIWKKLGRLDSLKIGVVGDLVHSRTIHSLLGLLGRNAGNSFVLYNPLGEELPRDYEPIAPILHCDKEDNFIRCVPDLNVVYLNRMQVERWTVDDERFVDVTPFSFGENYLEILPHDAIVLNPGPRLGEMPTLDDDRIVYYEQSLNGLFVRMAILCDFFCW